MANRPVGYGFTAETTKRIDDKYDAESEREAIDWINAVLGGQEVSYGKDNVQHALKDGVILCKVMNILQPGIIGKIHPAESNSFKKMENIANFLTAAEKYGCHRGDLFQSVYLTDGQNMPAVIGGIHAIGRKAQTNGFKGPLLGPKESSANPREFSEEQLLHGRVHGY
ncbi:myophilin-like [Clytia hemisphaerica]|uniref:Calponin-homology (CH) domain-containing protein n=1 Tax=Clytia hemisphaerica TaxID=252671 RepID=A0A069DLU3_9CNID|eukprot:TCONS_00008380-protein